jgi:hypothetical protein
LGGGYIAEVLMGLAEALKLDDKCLLEPDYAKSLNGF